jgi:hypothetical protein
MIKVIDGKKYDTDKAEVIAEWNNHYPSNDFKACNETLYLTAKGNWFLHGEGGATTKYAKSYGNSVSGGSDIKSMTPGQAYAWLVDCEEAEVLEKYFGDKLEEA